MDPNDEVVESAENNVVSGSRSLVRTRCSSTKASVCDLKRKYILMFLIKNVLGVRGRCQISYRVARPSDRVSSGRHHEANANGGTSSMSFEVTTVRD